MTFVVVLLAAYAVFVALLAGSFINLAADRIPRGESVVRPRSHCRSCDRRLNAVDLLPVVGWLVRRGRCATCGADIGVSSPLVEAICGLVMLASIMALGLWPGVALGGAAISVFGLGVVRLAIARRRAEAR